MSPVSIMRRSVVCALATLLAAAPAAVQAQAQSHHANFTGTWVLEAGRSDSSPLVPTGVKYVITDSAGRITLGREMTTGQGTATGALTFTTDGKPTTATLPSSAGPVEAITTSKWAGDTLVVKSAFAIAGTDVVQTDAWTLSPDGRSITVARSVVAGGQPLGAKLVLVRQ